MTHFGNIKSYDSEKGSGSIVPEKGGDALPFRKSDLQQEAQEPKNGERYGYELKSANNGRNYAVNLQHQQGEDAKQEQARAQQG